VKFLEAKRLVDNFVGGPPLPILLSLSGSAEPFDLYVRAAAAKRGLTAIPRTLPFNTLAQSLRRGRDGAEVEVMLLLPWDFVPESDWRSGSAGRADEAALREAALEVAQLIARRGARLLYLPAPMMPVLADPQRNEALALNLQAIAGGLGARRLPPDAFSLSGYFASGCPIGGASIGLVAQDIVELAAPPLAPPKKVLVTDLDNVMWSGGIGDDGLQGIAFDQHGRGYPHFVYQGFLRSLQLEGTLLAAVSRNDPDVALSPFLGRGMLLGEEDFVAIIASYNAKSAQIMELASRLNLGLDSFVFVDDNPVELAEVALALPDVRCIAFPKADGLPAFFSELATLFYRQNVTAEDRERTALYKRRLEGLVPSELSGADISAFLRSLGMRLMIHDRARGDRTRAIQLINKTNQFNLNGRRVTEQDVSAVLESGGRLYGASLTDRTGDHGEILACLVDRGGVIVSFVMSCRVFQRRVEHAFLAWLVSQPDPPVGMSWASTARNEPFGRFLEEVRGEQAHAEGVVTLNLSDIAARFSQNLELFELQESGARAA
jgi:FkbH-like protein